MDPRIHSLQQPLSPVKSKPAPRQPDAAFGQVLQEAQNVKVSKHAKQRMQERNIQMTDSDWQAISEKLKAAKQKGVTDSLVVMDKATLIASAKNHTVVTALNREESASQIFTNINGTIFINN